MNESFNPVQTTPYGMGYKIKSRLWGMVNHTLFRWTPFFMRRTRVMMLKACGANIAWNCSVSGRATIVDPWNLTMGALSSIDDDCCIRCRGRVAIGEKTCISRGVDLLSGSHDISSPNFELKTAPINIGNNVWIATKALVGMGVSIGDGAVIGAKACVFKDVEPWTVVGGNPARKIKERILRMPENGQWGGQIYELKVQSSRFKVESLELARCCSLTERRVAA